MDHIISISKFKPQMLKYFREIERTKQELIITDRGIPVLKIIPFSEDPMEARRHLRGSVLEYKDSMEKDTTVQDKKKQKIDAIVPIDNIEPIARFWDDLADWTAVQHNHLVLP